uniref:RNA helicase n=1 Tax=Denticeps clupeoides TaxID=299321 RepID=A0AAY4B9H9_9TELE
MLVQVGRNTDSQFTDEEEQSGSGTMAAPVRKAAHEIDGRKRTDDVLLSDGVEFGSLLLSQPVLEGLSSAGFQRPSPIQLKAIPLGRCGLDLIVQAKSGTGKTCVFATIALDSLIPENATTQVLVLAPTREIAVQIHSVIMAIGSAIEGLECHVFIGGTPVSQDKVRLKKCQIAVGSPGRIKQLIELGFLHTTSIRLFVLDEADKLLEEGSFQDQINWIFSSLPVNKQMLALSATYPESLARHLAHYMREPTFVRLNPTDPGLIGLKQYYKLVHSHALPHKVFEEKVQNLLELFSKVPFNQALVFSNLHSRAQQLADILSSKGLPSVCISGGLSQEQRLDAMSKLKQYQCRVLISTDLTSRGIDAEKVNLVINLDVPHDWETYMHRIGRAGRFGTHGLAVTYCCHGEEENKMMAIAQKCSLNLAVLPEPIPAGLIEETSDWDVTIDPPAKADLALLSRPKTEKARKQKTEATVLTTAKQVTTTASDCHEVKQAYNKAAISGKSFKSSLASDGSLIGGDQMDTHTPSRKELQDALPKIPPLSFFKPRLQNPMSFEEAVKDFEDFITHGPGRFVEIIRQFGGRDEGDQSPVNGQYRPDHDLQNDPPVQRSSEVNSYLSPSKSPSSSSSSDSESDMDVEQVVQMPSQNIPGPSIHPKYKQVKSEIVLRHDVPKMSSRPQIKQVKAAAFSSSQRQQAPTKSKELPGSTSQWRGQKKSKEARQVWKDEEDEVQEEWGGADEYWRSYYRSWKDYYTSLPPSYQQAYHSAHAWMAAYRMNTVYMREMMRY